MLRGQVSDYALAVLEYAERASKMIGLWPVRLIGVVVLLGVNHGVWHWIVGGILVASILLEIPAWLTRRRRVGEESAGRDHAA